MVDKLDYVTIEITKQCNFRCRFCYTGSNQASLSHPKSSISMRERILEQLVLERISKVTLTGGEPLLDKETLLWFFRELHKRNIQINLNTNLSLLDDEVLNEYLICVGKDIYIFTSLLSPCREKCDYMTGVIGSYDRIINGLSQCHNKGIKVSVNFTLGQDNICDLDKVLTFSQHHHLERVSISQVIPPYYDRKSQTYFMLCEQMKAIAETLVKIHDEMNIPVASSHPIPLCIVGEDSRFSIIEMTRCQTGTRYCAINLPTGNVFACSQEHRNFGNVYKEPLRDCWLRMCRSHGIKMLKPRCRKCNLLQRCGGECKWNGCITSGWGGEP